MAQMDCNKLWEKNNTEPNGVAAIARRAAETEGNATVVGSIVAPATAPIHAVGPRRRTRRVSLRIAAITARPILAPLPHITTHIIQAQFIRLFLFYGVCLAATIIRVPSHIAQGIATCILIPSTLLTTASSIFPLCFSG